MLLATAVQAAPPPPYVVSSLPDNARLTIYSEYLPDPEGTLSLEAVTAGDFEGRFKPASRFVERLGLSDHPCGYASRCRTNWATSAALP